MTFLAADVAEIWALRNLKIQELDSAIDHELELRMWHCMQKRFKRWLNKCCKRSRIAPSHYCPTVDKKLEKDPHERRFEDSLYHSPNLGT
eukprot:c21453_g1_i1 orf=265-534(-)